VDALTAKTDVKARAQAKASQLSTRVKGKADQARQQASQQVQQASQQAQQASKQVQQHPVPLAVSASAAVLVVLFIMGWRRG
jgi:type VI protein secretion system component VasF